MQRAIQGAEKTPPFFTEAVAIVAKRTAACNGRVPSPVAELVARGALCQYRTFRSARVGRSRTAYHSIYIVTAYIIVYLIVNRLGGSVGDTSAGGWPYPPGLASTATDSTRPGSTIPPLSTGHRIAARSSTQHARRSIPKGR
eukprot:1952218-Rhodomonas_salina.1